MPQTPAPQPVAPTVAPVGPFAARATPSASAIYQGFRAQRRELTNQLDELEGTRREITSQLEEVPVAAPERKPLEDRAMKEWDDVKKSGDLEKIRSFVRVFGTAFAAGNDAG